ncbi:hypothetical protein OJ996_05715 [Luteolibacter sp. GHJ8]|uniref:DUF86 domain-containing protein n=1 Tax=Luteolibacter rhizosphaerae TaxID=2989719 RepID=A0ABT3FZP6_9BACT|nr:hypothetical protein [Luteolibacter rhizosphaerae]MCW1913058.1 hypothetical protein [Luteolibacter rhizosphaerae]
MGPDGVRDACGERSKAAGSEPMNQYFSALDALLDAVDPADQVGNLKIFAAVDSLTRTIEESLDLPPRVVEKLRKFRWETLYAIVPGEQMRHLPSAHYISEARFALRQAAEEFVRDM